MKKNLIKQLMSVMISISILSQGLMANVTTPEQDREEFIEYLQAQQEVYKKEFDKEMILESLDYDVDKIIDFVSNKIVYQAYDGILRGVEGTLIGRAGNSHDQALTLASMLNDADVEAQIMVGELSDVQIDELNQHIRMATFPMLQTIDTADQPKIAQKINVAIQKNLEKHRKQDNALSKNKNSKIAQTLYDNISEQIRDESKAAFKKELKNSSLSYRWVRYKNATNNTWVEVHPAYEKAKNWKLKLSRIEAGSINHADLQKLSVELWIENSDGKKHSITGKWTAPTANLIGKTLSIEIMSDAMLQTNGIDNVGKTLEKSHYFFARINNELTKEGKVFDLKGNIYPGATVEGLNTIFAEVGTKLSEVTSMFNDSLNFESKAKNNSLSLQKVWLQFTIEKPNTKNETIHRILFNRHRTSNPKDTALTLLQGWDISLCTTKPMNHSYQRDRSKQLLDEITFIDNFKAYVINNRKAKNETILDVASSLVPKRSLIDFSNIRSHFDNIYFENTISYPSQIQILALRKGFLFSDNTYSLYKTMDIVSNTRWSFEKNGKVLLPSFLTSIKHGVWETEAETYKVVKETGITSLDSAFHTLRLKSNAPSRIIPFNPHTLNHKEKAWWQIDHLTGSTKGMIKLRQGYAGGDIAEEGTLLTKISEVVSKVFFVKGTNDCIKGGGAACCVGYNGGLWVAGIFGGGAMAGSKVVTSMSSKMAANVVGIASIEFDVVTSTLPVTDWCK